MVGEHKLRWSDRSTIAFQIFATGSLISSGWSGATWLLGVLAALIFIKGIGPRFREYRAAVSPQRDEP